MSAKLISSKLPPLFKHMSIAIFDKLPGSEKERFLAAITIARGRLVGWGYLSKPEKTPFAKMKLTGKGLQQNKKHTREGAWKSRVFEKLFVQYLDNEVELQRVELLEDATGKLPAKVDVKKVSKAQKDRAMEEKKESNPSSSKKLRTPKGYSKVAKVGKTSKVRRIKAL